MTTSIILGIVFLVAGIASAVISLVFKDKEWAGAFPFFAFMFGVFAGFCIEKTSIEQDPSALDVYRGKTELVIPIEEGDVDSVVIWKRQ